MPVHPELQPILDLVNAAEVPISELGAAGMREQMDGMVAMFGTGPDVASVENRTIPGPDGEIPVRIYRPLEPAVDPAGAVVFFHGGGFVIGSLASHDSTCRILCAEAGVVVIAVDYRLAPEHPFPAAPQDCNAALAWVHANADELGVAADRLAVAGDSAGGNLAAVAAQFARQEGIPLAFQLLVYPVVDLDETSEAYPSRVENAEGYLLTQDTMVFFGSAYLSDPSDGADPLASPLRAEDLSGLAPALVITAEFDPLRDEGEAYAKALADAGVEVIHTRYDGCIHIFFQLALLTSIGRQANDEAVAALRKRLG